jgi:hypothetical protein
MAQANAVEEFKALVRMVGTIVMFASAASFVLAVLVVAAKFTITTLGGL